MKNWKLIGIYFKNYVLNEAHGGQGNEKVCCKGIGAGEVVGKKEKKKENEKAETREKQTKWCRHRVSIAPKTKR